MCVFCLGAKPRRYKFSVKPEVQSFLQGKRERICQCNLNNQKKVKRLQKTWKGWTNLQRVGKTPFPKFWTYVTFPTLYGSF